MMPHDSIQMKYICISFYPLEEAPVNLLLIK